MITLYRCRPFGRGRSKAVGHWLTGALGASAMHRQRADRAVLEVFNTTMDQALVGTLAEMEIWANAILTKVAEARAADAATMPHEGATPDVTLC